jgi:hypothetical protein
MKRVVIVLLSTILLASCFKEPSYPPVPEIAFMRVSSVDNPILALTSDVYMQFSFQDGDGDLGRLNESDTTANMFVKDLRFGIVSSEAYSIPPIPRKGSSPAVKGDISFNFRNSLFCNPLEPSRQFDTIQYEIFVRDRAGNISNTITTPPIVVRCF